MFFIRASSRAFCIFLLISPPPFSSSFSFPHGMSFMGDIRREAISLVLVGVGVAVVVCSIWRYPVTEKRKKKKQKQLIQRRSKQTSCCHPVVTGLGLNITHITHKGTDISQMAITWSWVGRGREQKASVHPSYLSLNTHHNTCDTLILHTSFLPLN